MESILQIVKYVPVLIASLLLGSWFLAEDRKAKKNGKPWYAPYKTAPGILIVLALVAAVLIQFILR